VGESGGKNLYGFVNNSPSGAVDKLGLEVNTITSPISMPLATCCAEADKVTIGLIIRGKYSEAHEPGVLQQHADATFADGSIVGFFRNPNGGSGNSAGFGLSGVVADKAWFEANRPGYVNADKAKQQGIVSTYCTLKVCPSAATAFKAAWDSLKSNPPGFSIIGRNCSARAGGCFESAGALVGGIAGLDTPNHLYEDLKVRFKNQLKCTSGYFGYDASGKPYVVPLPPGTPIPNTKGCADGTMCQSSP
jgi:hypothetical protein